MMKNLINTCFQLLESEHREVVSQSLSLLKIIVRKVDIEVIKEMNQSITKKLLSFGKDLKSRFRYTNQIKLVFLKLMRRIDPQEVLQYVPVKYKKFVNIIRKAEVKNQKKKKDKFDRYNNKKLKEEISEEEDDIDINIDNSEDQIGTWISEGQSDDDILDFLASDAAKHITKTNPNRKKKRKLEEEFKTDSEGRMIIEESDDDEIMEDIDDEMSDKEELPNKKTQRKLKPKGKEISGKHSGVRYKSEKAGGDVKKGKLEPYAYIPLDPKQLNKRRRNNSYKQYVPYVKKKKRV
jgi:ribosomal RNA-processing protein 12